MLKLLILVAVSVAACYGAPQNAPQRTCGEVPTEINRCLNLPRILSLHSKCNNGNECERITCLFRKSKWLKDGALDKTKFTAFLDQFAKDHPVWSDEIQHSKTACLGSDLKAQGVYLNCPAYDVAHCVLTTFIKHASPTQWSSNSECGLAHWYASSCPVCPSDCYALQIPIGSCNACLVP